MENSIDLKKYLPKRFNSKNNILSNKSINEFIKKYPATMIFIDKQYNMQHERRMKNTLHVAKRRSDLRKKQQEFNVYCDKIKQQNIELHAIIKQLCLERTMLLNKITQNSKINV